MIKLRSFLFLFLAPFVGNIGRSLLARWLLRARVGSRASIGIALIDANQITLSEGSKIGHFSIIRNIDEVLLEDGARIGTFNWIFGARGCNHFLNKSSRISALILRRGASVTSRHILDCTDTIEIGEFTTVAGYRSQILTHSIDILQNTQVCDSVKIGSYSFIGTGCVILKGARFPPNSVLGAGSVFSGSPIEEFVLYSGVPAVEVKKIPETARYMSRTQARVH